MKKFILTALVLSLAALASTAQTESPKFKGIPVEGDAAVFVDGLKNAGFTYVTEGDEYYLLKGPFAGFNDCRVIVSRTAATNMVAKVTAVTEVYSTWFSMRSDYEDIKEAYTQKYGVPDSDHHFFSPPYKLGDGYEETAVRVDKCHYLTIWHVDGYTIGIRITSGMKICIGYENDAIMKVYSDEKESNRISDI